MSNQNIEALWEFYAAPLCGKREIAQECREKQLMIALRHYRRLAMEAVENRRLDPNAVTIATDAARRARIIWSLLAVDSANWITQIEECDDWVPGPNQISRNSNVADKRSFLFRRLADEESPLFTVSLDPSNVFLPRWLVEELKNGLQALSVGNTPLLFQPTHQGQSGRKRRKDFYRFRINQKRALQHVYFILGQGYLKKEGIGRVAAALNLSDRLVEDWDTDARDRHRATGANTELPDHLQLAQNAGQLHVRLASKTVLLPTETDDELYFIELMKKESLMEFGRRHQSEFPQRKMRRSKIQKPMAD